MYPKINPNEKKINKDTIVVVINAPFPTSKPLNDNKAMMRADTIIQIKNTKADTLNLLTNLRIELPP